MKAIGKVFVAIDRMSRFFAIVAGCIFLLMVAMTSYEVLMRYCFKQGIDWFIEVSGYLCVIGVYFGIAYTLEVGGHVSIDLLTNKRRKVKYISVDVLKIISYSLCTFFFSIMTYATFQVALESYRVGRSSDTLLAIPLAPFQFVVCLGWLLITLQGLSMIHKHLVLRKIQCKKESSKALK